MLEANKLAKIDLDGISCYNLACLYLKALDMVHALTMLRRAISKGYQNIDVLRRDPDLDLIRAMPEFQKLMKELEEKIAREENG